MESQACSYLCSRHNRCVWWDGCQSGSFPVCSGGWEEMLDFRGTGGSVLEARGTSCPARELGRHEDLVVKRQKCLCSHDLFFPETLQGFAWLADINCIKAIKLEGNGVWWALNTSVFVEMGRTGRNKWREKGLYKLVWGKQMNLLLQ